MKLHAGRISGAIAVALLMLMALAACAGGSGVTYEVSPIPAGATATTTAASAATGTATTIPPTIAVSDAITGSVLIENGRSMAGGTAGDSIELEVRFSASSTAGRVQEMRVRAAGAGCVGAGEMEASPWEPFTSEKTYKVTLFINIQGWYANAQYRDDHGNVSPVFCDDISVEGMPRR